MRRLTLCLALLFIFTIPWEVVIEHPVVGSASRLIGLALAATWFLTVMVTGRVRRPMLFHAVLCAFVALNAASILWTANPERTAAHTVTWAQLLLMSFIFWDTFLSRTAVRAALEAYILGTYVAFASTLLNYFGGNMFYHERFSAAGTHPDDLGVILALGIPAAIYLATLTHAGRWAIPLKVVNCAYIAMAFIGIALSGTRAAVIVSIPGAVFGIATLARLRRSVRVAVPILILAAAFAAVPLVPQASLDRLGTTRAEMAGGDLNGRVRLWKEGLASFVQHPFLGIGSDMYRSINSENKVAHNSFVSVLVELGAAGLFVFTAIIACAAVRAIRQPVWERRLWFSIFVAWAIGASALTWEYRKPTWLFLNLMVVSASVFRVRENAGEMTQRSCERDWVEQHATP